MPNPRAQKPLSFDQIIKDAKSLGVPAQALLDALAGGLKGSVTATAGAPADIYNLLNQFSFRGQLPTMLYGSEDISKMLPDVIPTDDKSRQHTAEVGETMGNFIPTPMAGQALKGAVKLGVKGARALGEGLGQLSPSGSGPRTLYSQVGAIKPKGGNWFKDEVENKLGRLKSNNREISPSLFEGFEQSAKDPTDPLQERSISRLREHNDEIALNNWVDKNLTNYVKKELATPEDPVRLAIDSRVAEANEKFKVDMDRANKVAQRAKEETDPRRQANFQREANRLTAEANNNLELGIKHSSHLPHEPNYFTPEDIKSLGESRKEQGFPAKGMGKSDEAKAYEMNADNSIYPLKASTLQNLPEKLAKIEEANVERLKAQENLDKKFAQHLRDGPANLTEDQIKSITKGMGFDDKEQLIGDDTFSQVLAKYRNLSSPFDDYNLKRLENNPYINKLAPDTNIYSAQTGDLGFDHIIDVLKENLASGRLTSEELKNISMEQAVRKTADYDLELAKKMQEAQAKNLENMTVHKEYPEGLKWVQLDKPGQFSAESDAMGHSVRGYEPPKGHPDWVEGSGDSGSSSYGHGGWEAIKSGKAKVYSLVDPKGNPHTTVEVGKGKHPIGITGDGNNFPYGLRYGDHNNNYLEIPEEKQLEIYNLGKKLHFENPNAYAENRVLTGAKTPNLMDSFQKAADMLLGEKPGYITQIKGKGNAKPVDTYIPYVQDFVKSGNWSDVGDLRHTDLSNVGGKYYTEPELIEVAKKYGRMGVQDTPWEVARQRHIDAGVPEEEALANWVDAFRDGRGRLDIPPEPPIEGMKRGGAVHISDNPDSMYMELMDKKMKGGGSEDDVKASFGVFPQLKPYRENQDPEASKDMPLQALRGRLAGTLGFIPDMVNLPLAVVNAIKGTDYKVPYGTEHYLETLPLKATSPAGELSGEVGSFFPSTAMIKAQLQGLKGLGKMAGSELGRRAISGESFTPLMNTAMPMTHVVKHKGGNWLEGSVEKELKGLKTNPTAQQSLEEMRQVYPPDQMIRLSPETREFVERAFPHLEKQVDLNNWVDKNLTNYVKNEMGTPDDPVRLGIENRAKKVEADYAKEQAKIAKLDNKIAQAQQVGDQGSVTTMQATRNRLALDAENTRELAEKNISHSPLEAGRYRIPENIKQARFNAGFPIEGMSKSDLAKPWEHLSDASIKPYQVGSLQNAQNNPNKIPKVGQIFKQNPWLSKLNPEDIVHETRDPFNNLGFDHILDVLKEDITNGRLSPESLKNVSMEQAVQRTIEYNIEMAKKMAEAQFKVTEGMPVVKEYPEGYKWIELTTPKKELPSGWSVKEALNPMSGKQFQVFDENGSPIVGAYGKTEKSALNSATKQLGRPELEKALKYEGETMGNCVGGYCSDVLEGRSRIYSLRDAKGEPHVTVEVKPQTISKKWSDAEDIVQMDYPQLYNAWKMDTSPEMAGMNIEDWLRLHHPENPLINAPPNIIQIKGKGNAKPVDKYLPMFQDFQRTTGYPILGDLENSGFRELGNKKYATNEELKFLASHHYPEHPNMTPQNVVDHYSVMKKNVLDQSDIDKNFIKDIESGNFFPSKPPIEGMKQGGSVSISTNPDTMYMELMDKKMKGGGAEDNTKLTPSQWLQAQANKPTEPFTPIEDLTANLKAIANFPSKMYEGAKQLVTDPRAYFADMKAPTAEELAMAFNPAKVGMIGMAEKVGNLKAIDALFPNKTESMLTSAEKSALTKYKKDLDVPAVMRRELFRTTGTGDIETPSLKMRPEKGLSPDYLEDKYVVPILWDTSGAGTNVSQIAGVPLSQGLRSSTPTSVQKQGGRLYPLIEENAQQGVGGASMLPAASSKVNNLNTYSDKGPTVGVVMDMAEHGIDFSHHIAEPYVGMLNALRPSNDALKAFKQAIRETPVIDPITGVKTYPYTKFPGIDSPNIRDIIANGADDYSAGNIRKAIAQVGDTYAMEKLGFPRWSDIYKTMSMPDAKTGQSAKTILEVNPKTQLITPNFQHGSYNTGMGATYAGGLADVNNNIVGVPDTVLLKRLFDERLAQGKTIGNVRSSLLKSHHGQLMTAEDIARLREYLSYDKPKKKAKGGAIRNMASGGAVQSLETNLPALPKTDYHSIDKLMAHISKEHKIPPQKLHDDFVAKHHMTPDTWIKRK